MTPEEYQKLDEECLKMMGFSGANPSYVLPGPSNPPPPVIELDDRRRPRTPPPRDSRRTREVSNNNEHFSKNLDRFLKRSREISSSSGDFSQDLDIHRNKRMAEKRMDEERKARKNRYRLAKKMLEESDDSHTTVRHYDRNKKSRSRSRSRKSRTGKRRSRSRSRSMSRTRKRKSRSRSRSRSKRSRSKSQREPKLHLPWKEHHNDETDHIKSSPPLQTGIPILRNIGPSSYNPQLESDRYLPKLKPPPKASKGPPMVSRISSKTKPKENNNPNPNESPPSPTFEPLDPQVQEQVDGSFESQQEDDIIDNLLLKKFKKSNGQEINMLTTWYNEALDVKVFRCFICNREVRGSQDLFIHLKGSRHQEYMKKIENLRITNSNEDNDISQTVSMIKSETGNCHICSAKVKETKRKEHVKNCEKIETEGQILKSKKKCQICDKVFKTLPEAFYHVKTYHFQIKEEKIQTEKEPDHIDYSIEFEYKLVGITDAENFKPNYAVLWDLYTLPMVLKDPRLGKYQETTEYKNKMDAEGWVIQ